MSTAKKDQSIENFIPMQAIAALKLGNQRFLSNTRMNRNMQEKVVATKDGQKPFAAILSCMDSRAAAEIIFDQGIGDIFNIRIAGNVISEHVLGSLEYAIEIAKTPLIVILGHTSCGAVKGACDQVEMGNLTGLLHHIQPAVTAETTVIENRTSQNQEFVDKVTLLHLKNVRQAMLAESRHIQTAVTSGKILVETAIYDVATGSVHFLDPDQQDITEK